MPAERFQIHVSDDMLVDLNRRLDHVHWPIEPIDAAWERGTQMGYLQSLVSYWREQFDWRKQEAELNRFSQFRCTIDGVDIHFVHERGKGPNPIPILLTHGWPDSYVRYKKIIPLLSDPASYGGDPQDAFDVIVPCVPGFGFSGRKTGINNFGVSELFSKLMTKELGYGKFAAAGGDIGSGVTRYMAFNHPELLIGIHLTDIGILRNLLAAEDAGLLEEELQYKKNAMQWISNEGAYMSIQSTKPATLAYGLSDSPVGLAAWIIEKFHAWSDCHGDLQQSFSRDELLTNIMIYWVTNTIGSSAHLYYDNMHSLPPIGYIEVPTGMAAFPADILLPPKRWAERNLNITRWTAMQRGGHFTAMEEPQMLAEDIRAFYRPFRGKHS